MFLFGAADVIKRETQEIWWQKLCVKYSKTKIMKKNKKTPSELYQLLQDVTNHIIAWAKPRMKMSDLDAEARRMLGEYSEYFTHSLGHGVGIQIHESPRVSGKSVEVLEPGMVITIEPGIYGIPMNNEE
jgi:Xaa-Pro aminopeptidase